MSEHGHASAVQAALARGEQKRRHWLGVEHAGVYNTVGRCVLCGRGKYEHERQGN